MLVLIRVDGILYRPIEDVSACKAAIVAAAHTGGAFVPFLSPAGLSEVFITESTAIRIEVVDDDEPDGPPSLEQGGGSFDIDEL